MKKILLFLCCIFLPYSASAELDIYLSSQKLPYAADVWTSTGFPDSGSSKVKIDLNFQTEAFPSDYTPSDQDLRDRVYDLFSTSTPVQQQAYLESLLLFSKQNFAQYIGIALSPHIDTDISDKQAAGYILTPFESTFQGCGLNLVQRRSVVKTLIERIHARNFSNVQNISYANVAFGNCIIPFPDSTQKALTIPNSFPSNTLIAQSLTGHPLSFGAKENDVDLVFLSGAALSASYAEIQQQQLLELDSTRIETTRNFQKEVGKNKILFVHQNHRINLFADMLLSGNTTTGYRVSGSAFNAQHPLYIRGNDPEEKRVLSGWKQIQDGIYAKTLIQENSFETIGSVSQPKQTVGASTFYAIIYNYDITPALCELPLFSHDGLGKENFVLPESPWFHSSKYGSFVCGDDESGCLCDSSTPGCFLSGSYILSTPQKIRHKSTFQFTFHNTVELPTMCTSPANQKVLYDMTSPDVQMTLPGIPEASLTREYVSNQGMMYDGIQIREKKMYRIENALQFAADEHLDMKLRLYDPYDTAKTQEGVSGLASYTLNISKLQGADWDSQIFKQEDLEAHNVSGTIAVADTHMLDLGSMDEMIPIFTQVGNYQVHLYIYDAAGNEARINYYFDIVAAAVDPNMSTLEVNQRNTLYADNTTGYRYTLNLKDKYLNPVIGKQISSITHSCQGVSNCLYLRTNMMGSTPSGAQALGVFAMDTSSDSVGKLSFSLRSLAPGRFTESFRVSFLSPSITLTLQGQENSFLKPFQGILEVQDAGLWVSDRLPLEQLRNFRVRVIVNTAGSFSWNLGNFDAFLHARHPDTQFILSGSVSNGADGKYFSGTFESSLSEEEKHKTLLEIIQGTVSGVAISYSLGGETISYPLSGDAISSDPLILTDTRELQNPVKVMGNLQGVGNTHNLTERQNLSDINTATSRSVFRKTVEQHIKSRQDDTVVGGVKYIDKTNANNKIYILENTPNYETLIVRNGNIQIRNNFNTTGKVIGIISYMDAGYNTEQGYENIGNIYVEPEVEKIQAFLYADGGLISTQAGVPLEGDILTRTQELDSQLKIVGSLFSRNTFAGGRALLGEYMLPGGQKTPDQDLAVIYDLYYTRRGNQNCERDSYGFCNHPHYLIIEYDPRIQSSPPKLFEQ